MLYKEPQPIRDNGVRFVLDQGTPEQLYDFLVGALAQHYQNNGLVLNSPARPNFSTMPFGETVLAPHRVTGQRSHGYINMKYFRGGVAGKQRVDVDYLASRTFSHTDDKTTYDSITAFFNTCLPRIPKDAEAWARTAERDVFLEKVVSGELI
jgi:hypothetical protein